VFIAVEDLECFICYQGKNTSAVSTATTCPLTSVFCPPSSDSVHQAHPELVLPGIKYLFVCLSSPKKVIKKPAQKLLETRSFLSIFAQKVLVSTYFKSIFAHFSPNFSFLFCPIPTT
jgi:hypothetical protein